MSGVREFSDAALQAKLGATALAIIEAAVMLHEAKDVSSAYDAQHFLEELVNSSGELFCQFSSEELGFKDNFRAIPDKAEFFNRAREALATFAKELCVHATERNPEPEAWGSR